MQIIISDTKSGKSYRIDIPKDKETEIIGKKIGDRIDGGIFGAVGYEFELTGGSDDSGFPMRTDVAGSRKIKALLTEGTGFHTRERGQRRRKIVRGNAYSADITQVNAKVVIAGATALDSLFRKEEKKEEEKK